MTTETHVTFNLWAVLVFLFLAGATSFTFLYAEGKDTQAKQQDIKERVIKLESQYTFIIEKIDKLTVMTEKMAEKLGTHTRNLEKRNPAMEGQ